MSSLKGLHAMFNVGHSKLKGSSVSMQVKDGQQSLGCTPKIATGKRDFFYQATARFGVNLGLLSGACPMMQDVEAKTGLFPYLRHHPRLATGPTLVEKWVGNHEELRLFVHACTSVLKMVSMHMMDRRF